MCVDALKKAVKVMAITALVLVWVLLVIVGIVAFYFGFCGGHPHGLC
jgi:hypothetical protein